MDGEAGWWTTSGNIGLPPLARAMGVGRQQQQYFVILLKKIEYIVDWHLYNHLKEYVEMSLNSHVFTQQFLYSTWFETPQTSQSYCLSANINVYIYIYIYIYEYMKFVFPIAMHTIEIIKQHNTCTFYIRNIFNEEKNYEKNSTLL